MTAHARAALAIFVAFTGLYLLLLPGQIRTPDGTVMFRVSQALVERGQVDIPPLPAYADFGGQEVVDPTTGETHFYAWFGLGQSLVAAPGVAAARALAPLVRPSERGLFDTPVTVDGRVNSTLDVPVGWKDEGSRRRLWYDTDEASFDDAWQAFGATWTNPVLSAATLALLVLLAGELGMSLWAGVVVALVAGLASPTLPYAATFFSEPLTGLCWTAAVMLMVRGRRQPLPALPLAGLVLGLMVLTRVAQAALALPLLLFWLAEHRGSWLVGLRRGLWVLLGALPGLLAVLAYNQVRFGSPLETGYGQHAAAFDVPIWRGLSGLLISPGRGLLFYAPAVILGTLSLGRLRDRRVAALAGMALATLLLLYGRWHWWEGGWCWGPRFLVPVLPVLLLPLGTYVDDPPVGALRLVLPGALLVGLLVTVPTIVVSYHDYYQWMKAWFNSHPDAYPALDHYYPLLRWSWRFAPLYQWWTFPVRDNLLLPHALAQPGLILTGFGVAAAMLISGVLALVRQLHGLSPAAARSAPRSRPGR